MLASNAIQLININHAHNYNTDAHKEVSIGKHPNGAKEQSFQFERNASKCYLALPLAEIAFKVLTMIALVAPFGSTAAHTFA